MEVGKAIIPDFKITSYSKPIYASLHDYFHGREGRLSLNKGIALIGEYGVGKSTAFRVFHTYIKTFYPFNPNLFVISSVEDLMAEMSSKDWTAGRLTYNMKQTASGGSYKDPRHVLINEFGFQYDVKLYGSDLNQLIEAWLMKRYDIFQEFRKVVHITSNFGKKDLKANFSDKLIDRFKEMFHFIELKGESLRK